MYPAVFEPEEVIIQAGQAHYTEPLAFYVIADGQVDVIEHGRVTSRLLKGDSFGEWGISHQRASDRRCHCPSPHPGHGV